MIPKVFYIQNNMNNICKNGSNMVIETLERFALKRIVREFE